MNELGGDVEQQIMKQYLYALSARLFKRSLYRMEVSVVTTAW